MSLKIDKTVIDIRAKLKVDRDSPEASMDKYLKDSRAVPYEKHKMIMGALRTHYLPLVYQYEDADPAKLRQSLLDAKRSWEIHFEFLQERLGIEISEEKFSPALSTPTSMPVPINHDPQQYTKNQPQRNLEPEIKSQEESEQRGEYTHTHVFD